MKLKQGVSMALTLAVLYGGAAEASKEEVIYGVLDKQGNVDGLYAVNIFPGGDIVDYGDYSSVHALNTEDTINYDSGVVRFHSDAGRVFYQGNLNGCELPWLFRVNYYLDGKQVDADALAGQSGHVEIELEITANDAYTGEITRSHALQITATLDADKCQNIVADGATQANVGQQRQLSYIVLPNTEQTIRISTDAQDFEMDAISINGVRLSLDMDVDDSEITEKTDEIVDAVVELDDGAQELDGHSAELLDGADEILDALFDSANEELEKSRGDFSKLGIKLHTLDRENYTAETQRLQSELLDKVDDYVHRQAEATLRSKVEEAAAEQVRQAVYEAARTQVTEAVTAAAREEVRSQVEAGGAEQVRQAVEAAVEQQVRQQVETAARQQVRAVVRAAFEAQILEAVTAQLSHHTPAPTAEPTAEPTTEPTVEPTAEPTTEPTVEPTVEPTTEPAVEASAAPIVETEAEATAAPESTSTREEGSPSAQLLQGNAAYAEENSQVELIEAIVRQRMSSEEVQSQIDTETEAQMQSEQVQQQIQQNVEAQMQSDEVRALIEREVAERAASDETQAAMDSMVEAQMQSEQVQQLIAQNVEAQMATDEVRALIDENIETQLASDEVKQRISDEIAIQRNSREYLNSVAEALEENGENGEAYRALTDLRDSLDKVIEFYDGLVDYTDGVREIKDGTEEFRSETDGIHDEISDRIDNMIAEKTGSDVPVESFVDARNRDVEDVQFVVTTPSIRKQDAKEMAAPAQKSASLGDKIRNLFRK